MEQKARIAWEEHWRLGQYWVNFAEEGKVVVNVCIYISGTQCVHRQVLI